MPTAKDRIACITTEDPANTQVGPDVYRMLDKRYNACTLRDTVSVNTTSPHSRTSFQSGILGRHIFITKEITALNEHVPQI